MELSNKSLVHSTRAAGDPLVKWISGKTKQHLNNSQERYRVGLKKYVKSQVSYMDDATSTLGYLAEDTAHDALLDVWEVPTKHKLASLAITAIRHDLLNALEKQRRWNTRIYDMNSTAQHESLTHRDDRRNMERFQVCRRPRVEHWNGSAWMPEDVRDRLRNH